MGAGSKNEVVIKRKELREQHPEIINLDSDMTDEQGAQIEKLKLSIQNKLKGGKKTPDKNLREKT